jgi:uncharacterized damage-inducible protein DinB
VLKLTTLERYYVGWDRYQSLLVETIQPLTDEQLALRSAEHMWPVWMLAAHVISVRVGWFEQALGEVAPELAALYPWDAEGAEPRSASELVDGLELTWEMIRAQLATWAPENLDDTFTTRWGNTRSIQWVIWHLLEHDIHHGGEIALTLGMHGLPVPEL